MKRVNIKDIAKIAGVGVATVSRVLNNHPDVKDETRENVLKIIEDYHYIPNNSARNLKRIDSEDIGVLVKGISNPLFSLMTQIMEQILSSGGYSVIIHHQLDNRLADIDVASEFVQEKRLKGLICLGGDFEDVDEKLVRRLGVPLLLISSSQNNTEPRFFSSVGIDNEIAALKAVSYLCEMGHRKIGIITSGEGDKNIGRKRTEGYLKALSKFDIEKVDARFELGGYTFESAYEAMKRLLVKAPEITAVFAISDIMAIGAMRAIFDMGLNVPEDISIIGFDDIDYARYYKPALTTVRQPVVDMAEKSAELMIEAIESEASYEQHVFNTELMVRETVKSV